MKKIYLSLLIALPVSASSSDISATTTNNGHELVDLGLSVKWATCNVGASKPEGYGNYYAWGETKTKSNYTYANYRYIASGNLEDDNMILSKYNTERSSGTIDNKTTLDLSDDVARQKWGGSWRMPTRNEFEELRDNCTWVWTMLNGVKGFKVTSKKRGYTNRSIFLPAAGYRQDKTAFESGTNGNYWTSSLCKARPFDAFYYNFDYKDTDGSGRNNGLSVRPVCP